MKRSKPITSLHMLRKQRGVTLIFALVMVLLLSFVGTASMKSSHIQEKMIGNVNDTQVAFDAAESTLREVEAVLALGASNVPIGAEDGYVESFNQSNQYWLEESGWSASATADFAYSRLASSPSYVVEELSYIVPGASGGAVDMASMLNSEPEIAYRVTARATGGSDTTVVVVQSTFK